MSIPTSFHGLRVSVDRGEKIGNKSQISFTSSGDDNANQITSVTHQEGRGLVEVTGFSTSSIPPLVRQSDSPDKIVIWGSEQECMEPDLREFELLDCQEIHTFLRNRNEEDNEQEEDDGGSYRDGKDEGPMSISSSSTASSASVGVRRNDNSNKVESRIQRDKEKRVGCHSTEELDKYVTGSIEKRDTQSSGDRRKGGLKESKSETNVFVSSLSAVALSGSLSSALDSSGAASLTSLSKSKINTSPNANNTTSAQSSRRAASVDANQNSPPMHPQHDCPQYCSQEQRLEERNLPRNGLSSDGGLGQRRKAGFEERVLPPRRQQLVRPLCQTEMGRERNLTESKLQETGSNRKFAKSSLREPSDFSHLYNTTGVYQLKQPNQATQREAPPVQKHPTATAQPISAPSNSSIQEKKPQTQLTYRRNCSSPNRTGVESRSSTPPHSPLRTPQGSPRRQPSMYLISRNVSGAPRHVPPGSNPAIPTSAQGYGNSCLRAPVKTNVSTSGIPKAPPYIQQSSPNSNPKENSPSPKLKPKGVRPKIITYVRKNPQFKPQASDGPYQVSSLPSRLSTYTHSQTPTPFKDTSKDSSKPDAENRGAPVLSASNVLYDKYRQEMQANSFPAGMQSRSIRAPGHTNTVPPAHSHSHNVSPKLSRADNFYGTSSEVGRSISLKGSSAEDALQVRTAVQVGGSSSLMRSGRGMRLGLGAVTRTASGSAKSRGASPGQRSAPVFSQPVQPVSPATSQKSQDNTDEQAVSRHPPAAPPPAAAAAQPSASASRSLLPKVSPSGLRPPGFSACRLPAGRLAAFGFVRSSSVSSASSAHSADSTQSDPCRTAHRASVSEEPPVHRVTTSPPSTDHQRTTPYRSNSLQPPSTPALPRRYLPPQPRSSPGVGRKEFQRSSEVTRSLPSSPKRLAVVPPKPQSPVQPGQRPAAAVRGSTPSGSPRRVAPLRLQQEHQENLQREKEEAQQKEKERQAEEREKEEQRQEVQRLQGSCEQQERQLKALRDELKKMSLGLEAFIITTQHYRLKNETAEECQRKLSLEIQKIREEMASQSLRWERLQQDKAALEVAFEHELQELQLQQEAELAAVEKGLRKCHTAELEHLKVEHRSEMEELTTQQQEQMEEMTVNQQAAIQELRDMHNITMATLHEEHARTMRDLRKAHEQQKSLLEEDFEKLRLSLQDQVDTLTFQNESLKDKAKRFEEALRRSTDEQIIDALAPYQHIEQDLKSLKEVVEMKNQQIHQQEKKISDLERVQAQKNVFLEEKVQVLQQQNEDLKARIDMNLATSRQLSEENANLHESVEKESTEKKRLSRNNEELLWLLQTSPLMSPASSPLHRSFSTSPIPSSPLLSSSPFAGCDSPTHCHGCPRQAQCCSPSHRAAANQNYSPGPNTPTHRASASRFNSNASLQS
ncbi:microtubule-associated tumor suppressor candidate 2 isoform X1 [Kryptolebias marmoratus]|uniref:microtubule-associated tumor suppressor candidate 2 isoform X1 n=1 Tax=Kryptolebias marmoratus TaxID=37003 RepID=UPI0018ACA79D|nr:microtubule-associated tumor suppressor candidate 2 isoform X1 [Kryptolebias marmoratus]